MPDFPQISQAIKEQGWKPWLRQSLGSDTPSWEAVQQFLLGMQYEWWDRRFISDAYHCRKHQDALYGVQRTQRMMQQVTNGHREPAHIIKFDCGDLSASLPRKQIYDRVKWGLDRQFAPVKSDPQLYRLYKTCDSLWRQVLFDAPDPAGRNTSGLISNIYLDQLDRFIKYDLHYKYYGRHIGDFFYMVPASEYPRAKQDATRIENFLNNLGLREGKRYYAPVNQGMQFLDARIYPHHFYLNHQSPSR